MSLRQHAILTFQHYLQEEQEEANRAKLNNFNHQNCSAHMCAQSKWCGFLYALQALLRWQVRMAGSKPASSSSSC
jgi:hypothetical protein